VFNLRQGSGKAYQDPRTITRVLFMPPPKQVLVAAQLVVLVA
jgi:hypothetical protein